MENKIIEDKNHLCEASLEHVRYFLNYTVRGISPCPSIVINSLSWILYDEISKRKSISINELSLIMNRPAEVISSLIGELVVLKLVMLDVVTHDVWCSTRSRRCIDLSDENSTFDGSAIEVVNINEPETGNIVTVAIL